MLSVTVSETDDNCIVLQITTSQNVRELIGFGPEFVAKNITLVFACAIRSLEMQHVMSAVEMAFPNKVARAMKKVCNPQLVCILSTLFKRRVFTI